MNYKIPLGNFNYFHKRQGATFLYDDTNHINMENNKSLYCEEKIINKNSEDCGIIKIDKNNITIENTKFINRNKIEGNLIRSLFYHNNTREHFKAYINTSIHLYKNRINHVIFNKEFYSEKFNLKEIKKKDKTINLKSLKLKNIYFDDFKLTSNISHRNFEIKNSSDLFLNKDIKNIEKNESTGIYKTKIDIDKYEPRRALGKIRKEIVTETNEIRLNKVSKEILKVNRTLFTDRFYRKMTKNEYLMFDKINPKPIIIENQQLLKGYSFRPIYFNKNEISLKRIVDYKMLLDNSLSRFERDNVHYTNKHKSEFYQKIKIEQLNVFEDKVSLEKTLREIIKYKDRTFDKEYNKDMLIFKEKPLKKERSPIYFDKLNSLEKIYDKEFILKQFKLIKKIQTDKQFNLMKDVPLEKIIGLKEFIIENKSSFLEKYKYNKQVIIENSDVNLKKPYQDAEIWLGDNSMLQSSWNERKFVIENTYMCGSEERNKNIVLQNNIFAKNTFSPNIDIEDIIGLDKPAKNIIHFNNNNLLDVTEKWWILPPNGDKDRKILPPIDYNYQNNNLEATRLDRPYGEKYIIDKHPLSNAPYFIDSYGKAVDLNVGENEIEVSINIMLDIVNIIGMIFHRETLKFSRCSGKEALEFLMETLYDWLNLNSTKKKMKEYGSTQHYYRCYRWIRWEVEKLWFEADYSHSLDENLGLIYVGKLFANLIDYMKIHHFNIVPIHRNLRNMDIERNFIKEANEKDLIKELDKNKSFRHYEIKTYNPERKNIFKIQ